MRKKFIEFDDVKRSDGQTIEDYIAQFDIKYSNLIKEDSTIVIPESIRAMMIIRKAALPSDILKLCLTGLDYDKKDTLFKIIGKYIRPGTYIISERWKAYQSRRGWEDRHYMYRGISKRVLSELKHLSQECVMKTVAIQWNPSKRTPLYPL